MKDQGSEIETMGRNWKAWMFAMIAALAFAVAMPAEARSGKKTVHHRHVQRHLQVRHGHAFARGRITYMRHAYRGPGGHGRGFVELVGDPDSGVGFYPLPYRYRIGAWRHHMRNRRPPWIENGVIFAMMADSARYHYYFATPINSYRYGVYDPFEGVGTPFFAGYYGPAAGDEDEPAFPFGRPYGP